MESVVKVLGAGSPGLVTLVLSSTYRHSRCRIQRLTHCNVKPAKVVLKCGRKEKKSIFTYNSDHMSAAMALMEKAGNI